MGVKYERLLGKNGSVDRNVINTCSLKNVLVHFQK